ncbi:type I-F CRISPR-associated endoribonuclease Cas6/Csy4 [Pseudomonas gingeri]|uniref:type I-F CRISPR-associated endoribonuclease Cas6/Csy4 n=1 Tax=Pseudomonas gingeri TaxID=117681 RepID=UPI0015A1F1A4|nr:type I-F CRISPR-associated endoribonuclease Cas6/Csy4 [Pseudomonas gingeri]NVZ99208.1 type I-F CRISPR-associated endoribonuclease Cas6/Csy4 [Pseudomonas gingeri]NWA13253.1 type I-F CRISPR-associated endoribonuclease Cas6/Csy4 [Pseudomonas gingeri]NWA55514.1 type I-F CRISPR-associated endoribonuclease Cas6/Csy4 [Pseudomonas gingeri]NWA95632.1 type I-F CRISPR-associated endoribonuclease Cas6/Csy4 [Pseudomonas gingeri]NWB00719.1 type I-F CRISPR-associated endoribonuclease Cas6/Csy4 [Pseudomona
MDHYIDLKLLPDPEFAATQLMSALLSKLHRGLHDLRRDDVGISFPDIETARHHLGSHLRLHGNREALSQLLALNWLTGMRDHVQLSEVTIVPVQVRYRQVSRVQVDSNPERLRRRLIKRHGISEQEARERIPDSAAKRCNLPFVNLRSNGTGQAFVLFIRHGSIVDTAQAGTFNGYGLSSTATIPWF